MLKYFKTFFANAEDGFRCKIKHKYLPSVPKTSDPEMFSVHLKNIAEVFACLQSLPKHNYTVSQKNFALFIVVISLSDFIRFC